MSREYISLLKSIGKKPSKYYRIYDKDTKEEILEIVQIEFIKEGNVELIYQLINLKNENELPVSYKKEQHEDLIKSIVKRIENVNNVNKELKSNA